jgi:Ca2+-binding EF-hand superfamily protein
LIKQLDKNNDGVIGFHEFTAGLRSMNIFITNHEEHALMKRFDYNGDGKISMEEFYNFIAEKW